MSDGNLLLLNAVDADTDGEATRLAGGLYTMTVVGTDFGGGTVNLQILGPGGTYVDVPDTSFTANGTINVMFGKEVVVRGRLNGASGPSDVSLALSGRQT